jgi:hypothetical protein
LGRQGAKASKVEPQDGKPMFCEGLGNTACREDVLATSKAMRKERVRADRAFGTVKARSQDLAIRPVEIGTLQAHFILLLPGNRLRRRTAQLSLDGSEEAAPRGA